MSAPSLLLLCLIFFNSSQQLFRLDNLLPVRILNPDAGLSPPVILMLLILTLTLLGLPVQTFFSLPADRDQGLFQPGPPADLATVKLC
jgi:hypothetical protein